MKEQEHHDNSNKMRKKKEQKIFKKRALKSKQFNRASDIRKGDIRNIWEACRHGATYKRLQQLTIGRNIMKVNERNFLFDTPLHVACRHGQKDVVKFLINKRADVNAISDTMQKTTPLHEAMYNGHFDCADLLLQNGANPEARDHRGYTPDQVCTRMVALDWWSTAVKDNKANFVPPPPPAPPPKEKNIKPETEAVTAAEQEKLDRQKRYEAAQAAQVKKNTTYKKMGW